MGRFLFLKNTTSPKSKFNRNLPFLIMKNSSSKHSIKPLFRCSVIEINAACVRKCLITPGQVHAGCGQLMCCKKYCSLSTSYLLSFLPLSHDTPHKPESTFNIIYFTFPEFLDLLYEIVLHLESV